MTYSEKIKDPRWQKKRLEILGRDNFTCKLCNDDTTELHVHHLAYKGEPWEQSNDRLVTLCKNCHTLIEGCFIDYQRISVNTTFKTTGDADASIRLIHVEDSSTVIYVFENGRILDVVHLSKEMALLVANDIIKNQGNGATSEA